jgi:Glycosyl hydrolases family 38 N-terminal domain
VTRSGSYSARVALWESLIPEEPRNELRGGVTGVDLEFGGVAVRAGDLPLFRRSDSGHLRQCLRLAVSSSEHRGPCRFRVYSDDTLLDTTNIDVQPGLQRAHLFVPTVEAPVTVELEIELDGLRRRAAVELRPQRRWRIFVIHHSHLDIGYTDPQARVLRQHLAYLDSALDYAAADDSFRWTIESNLVLERWLASRPPAFRTELLALLRSARFEACALPFTMHAEALSIDELARQLRFANYLRHHGVEVVAAMQTDVPGGPPGLPLVLADAGIRYLSVAHNWAARATPYLTGGAALPRAFHWQTQAGKRVLVWQTDSPHGVAYLEGNLLGLAESFESASELLPEYLAALATRPYPYATGVLGIPPQPELARSPYPHSVLHLRVQGATADNAAPSIVPARIARGWNEQFAYPELFLATNRDFFEALPAGELETFTGDWSDWWADGLGSAARAVGFNRRAQAAVRTAQTLHVLAGGVGAEIVAQVDRVYERMSLFDEHTWCAAHPSGDAVAGRESGALQWQTKAALATEALDDAEALLDAATAQFRSPERQASVLVLNPSGFARTDIVSVFLPISRIEPGRPFAIVDAETQARIPLALDAPETSRNRPRGRSLSFLAERVPALGYRRYDLVDDEAPPGDAAGELANEHYRLELDVEGGCALHFVDKELGLDFVDQTSAFGLGQVVHDLYASALQATMRLQPGGADVTSGTGSASAVFVASRSTPHHGVLSRVSNAVEERATVRLAGAGCDWIETTYRLVRRVRRLDVTHRLAKVATTAKEGVFVVFPLSLCNPAVAYELTGGVGGSARVPGSAEHVHGIRHWVALQDASATVAWSTLEAPLVQLGNVFLPYPPYPPTIDDAGAGLIASWAMNNVWDTNFPAAQGGEAFFSYALASATPGDDARALGIATAAALTQPLIGVLGGARDAPAGSICEIEAPGVEVALLAATEHGFVVHLQSYADRNVEVRVANERLTVAPGDYVTVPVELA